MDQPTRRFDQDAAAEPLSAEHPTRRLEQSAVPEGVAPLRREDSYLLPYDPALCSHCQGRMLWARPVGRDTLGFVGDLGVDGLRGARWARGRLEARMCAECGYTEFFAPVAARGTPTRRLTSTAPAPADRIPCAHCQDQVPVGFVGQ